MNAIAVCAGAGAGTLLLTGLVRRYAARRNMLDIPNERSSHTAPTPRGGGIAIVATYGVVLAVLAAVGWLDLGSTLVLLGSGAIVAAAGFLDDRRSLPARARFAAHAAAAVLFLAWMGHERAPWLADVGLGHPWLGALCGLLALTWSTNLFNFMDGIDGIAAGEAVFAAGAAAWISSHHGDSEMAEALGSLCAACAGFLVWNWPPARIFMGDVGSGFLGIMIPMLELIASARARIAMPVWIILGGLFLLDATVTLVRRVMRGDRWFEAHRLHAYQQLARRWNSHRPVTLLYMAINLFWLAPCAWYADRSPGFALPMLAIALAPVLLFVLVAGAGRAELTHSG